MEKSINRTRAAKKAVVLFIKADKMAEKTKGVYASRPRVWLVSRLTGSNRRGGAGGAFSMNGRAGAALPVAGGQRGAAERISEWD